MSRLIGRISLLGLVVILPRRFSSRPRRLKKQARKPLTSMRTPSPTGQTYFALSLMPQAMLPAVESSDVVVLYDTSASEVGPFRDKGIEVLRGLMATLGEKDHVKLMAVDLKAVPITHDFVSPRGADMNAAIEQLQHRTPLGARIWKRR